MASEYQPVIIVGAPRSGTNMLRDVLCSLSGFATWPCDEVNYMWRYGNASHASDEFLPELATPRVRDYVVRQFDRIAQRTCVRHVVEKTCANCLRVGFVHRIVPDAKYIFLYRDGRDAISSAIRRWKASLDLGYIVRKARFVPTTDLPYYAIRYARSRLHRLRSSDNRLSTWGPRFNGMQEMLSERTLAEVCAEQWKRCVELAIRDLEQLAARRTIRLSYEEFVSQPAEQLERLLGFLNAEAPPLEQRLAISGVSTTSVEKWRRALDADTVERVGPIIETTLAQFGYSPTATRRKSA